MSTKEMKQLIECIFAKEIAEDIIRLKVWWGRGNIIAGKKEMTVT